MQENDSYMLRFNTTYDQNRLLWRLVENILLRSNAYKVKVIISLNIIDSGSWQ